MLNNTIQDNTFSHVNYNNDYLLYFFLFSVFIK